MKKEYFYNTWKIVKFTLKKDKFKILAWLLALILFDMYALPYLNQMYPTQEARDTFLTVLQNPAMIAMFGNGYGLENYTYGAFYAHMMYVWLGLFNGIMAIMIVSKHLRAEEEEGRYEMVRSLPVGRNANLLASMIVMVMVFITFAILKVVSYSLVNVESITFAGTLNFSIGLSLIGIFFSVLTAVIAQIFQSNRNVMGAGFASLIGLYLLFSIGVLSSEYILWLSPFQWMLHSQAFVDNVYWPLIILLIVTLGIGILALYLSSIRDLDAGLLKQRTKEHKTKKLIKSPIGFALLLSKSLIIWWIVALFILGASYGSIFGDIENFVSGNDMLSNLLPDNSDYPTSVLFMSFVVTVMSIVSAIPALIILNKVSTEEEKGRMEIIQSHAIKKQKIVFSYLILSISIAVTMLFVSALGLYVASSSVMTDPISFAIILAAHFAYLPSIIFFLGLSLVFSGFLPRKIWIIWIYFSFAFFVTYMGQIIGLDDLIRKLSPFGFVPNIPVDNMNWLTQIVILTIGVLFGYVGLIMYKKRSAL